MKEDQFKIIKYEEEKNTIDVMMDYENQTVWLSQESIALLFDVHIPAINKHITNLVKNNEKLGATISVLEKVRFEGERGVTRKKYTFLYHNIGWI